MLVDSVMLTFVIYVAAHSQQYIHPERVALSRCVLKKGMHLFNGAFGAEMQKYMQGVRFEQGIQADIELFHEAMFSLLSDVFC